MESKIPKCLLGHPPPSLSPLGGQMGGGCFLLSHESPLRTHSLANASKPPNPLGRRTLGALQRPVAPLAGVSTTGLATLAGLGVAGSRSSSGSSSRAGNGFVWCLTSTPCPSLPEGGLTMVTLGGGSLSTFKLPVSDFLIQHFQPIWGSLRPLHQNAQNQ